METPAKQKIASRAAIFKDGKLLVIREATTYVNGNRHGFYDLPGGKVELGESIAECIRREVREEAGIEVDVGEPFYVGEWMPIVKGELLQIIAVFFVCTTEASEISLSQDHDDYRWITAQESAELPLTNPIPEAISVLISKGFLT